MLRCFKMHSAIPYNVLYNLMHRLSISGKALSYFAFNVETYKLVPTYSILRQTTLYPRCSLILGSSLKLVVFVWQCAQGTRFVELANGAQKKSCSCLFPVNSFSSCDLSFFFSSLLVNSSFSFLFFFFYIFLFIYPKL